MSLSSEEAAASLSQAESARRRSSELYFYHRSSPHLILWGVIWVVGYGGTGLFSHYANQIWVALMFVGIVGGIILGWRARIDPLVGDFRAWRMAALWFIILFFVGSTYAVMEPHFSRQFCAYPALITGTVYAAVGLWSGLRYVVTGVAVVALTLFGFYALEPHFYVYWMAVIGGGSMILAGLWFRTV